jgi:hypothetical protein
MTFDSIDEAAEAAKRWMVNSAEHNLPAAVRLEKLDTLPV